MNSLTDTDLMKLLYLTHETSYFEVALDRRSALPLIIMSDGSRWLLDSGSNIAVWYSSIKKFKKAFPSAVLLKKAVEVEVVGGKATFDVYVVPDFVFGQIHCKSLHIHVKQDDSKRFDFALPNSMFHDVPYYIDNRCHKVVFFVRDGVQLRERSNVIYGKDGKRIAYMHETTLNDNVKLVDHEIKKLDFGF